MMMKARAKISNLQICFFIHKQRELMTRKHRQRAKQVTFHFTSSVVVYFDQRLGAVHSKHWSKPVLLFNIFACLQKKFDNSLLISLAGGLKNILQSGLSCPTSVGHILKLERYRED